LHVHPLRSRALAALGLLVICVGQLFIAPAVIGGNQETYIVLYKQEAVAGDARARVERAGGTFVASYPQIGVVIARSSSTTFRARLMADNRIDGVAATTKFGSKVSPVDVANDGGALPNAPATDSDTLSGLQWDMMQIHTPQAHAITGGSPLVVVGDIDTGLDKDHPDLIPNIDFSRSVSCESGAPNQDPVAWDDHAGHGTHTAGTIAAAANGFGIVGVAPNVKIAGIKSSNNDGFFFPEMVVCSFMWAATHQIDVTNDSYFADPWLYNCRNDEEQHAIWKAEQRAIKFAQQNGVTVVASQGNDSDDRAHPTVDTISPDFPPGSEQERRVTNACVVIPLEVSGVIGVTATGDFEQVDGDADPHDYLKSYYSAYGVGVAELTAPGGDFYYGRSARAVNGLVLSTWPAEIGGSRRIEDPAGPGHPASMYRYIQGTSMAGPHVAGVAALIISRYGNLKNSSNGKMSPGSVGSHLQQTAASQPCPTELPQSGAPGSLLEGVPYSEIRRPDGTLQECQGGPAHNGWYGSGRVDALRAILHDTGN
jgi:lantibiotic leader peptide-processing serine protease